MNAFSLKVIAILDKIFEHTVPTLSCSNFTYKYEFIIALLNCAMPFFKKFHFTAYRSCRYSIVRKLLSYTGHSGLNFWAASGAIKKKKVTVTLQFPKFLALAKRIPKKKLYFLQIIYLSVSYQLFPYEQRTNSNILNSKLCFQKRAFWIMHV